MSLFNVKIVFHIDQQVSALLEDLRIVIATKYHQALALYDLFVSQLSEQTVDYITNQANLANLDLSQAQAVVDSYLDQQDFLGAAAYLYHMQVNQQPEMGFVKVDVPEIKLSAACFEPSNLFNVSLDETDDSDNEIIPVYAAFE